MRRIFIFLLSLFFGISYASHKVFITPPPKWVKPVALPDHPVIKDHGGYQYLLIDIQDHLPMETNYRNYAIKILNAEGVQSMSTIDVLFDPSYQQLKFHEIKIIRENETIDKLRKDAIQILQRETSMERHLYDGSLSAVVNLTDVREGDIIVYSYSLVGFNPVNKGHYSGTYYHQFTVPVNHIFNRVITDPRKALHYKLYNGAAEPERITSEGLLEYVWEVNALKYKLYDNNTPSWFDPHKRVSVSTFGHWKEVVEWALPLYKYPEKEIGEIKKSLPNRLSKKESVEKLIRLVQDEVRYLGFESGIGAYRPHSPLQVFTQRYGDCKDKSLLLVALLRSEGIPAYPLLVHTQAQEEIQNKLPSPGAFDHCVVNFSYEGKEYFIDPTIAHQGGNLSHIAFPDYTYGLLVKPGTSELIRIPEKQKSTLHIEEFIFVDSIGGRAELKVKSEYTGRKADRIRGYFNTNSRESIQKEYLNYYSNLYPDISVADEIKLYDDDRDTSNKIIVEESYLIRDFWLDSDDHSYIYCELYPLVLESQIDYPTTTSRNMPYYMGEAYSFSQNTQVNLPEPWVVEDAEKRIEGDGFIYENTIKGYGTTVSITHTYDLTRDFIPGESAEAMLKKHEDIRTGLPYYLTYQKNLSGFKLSWISMLLVILALGAGIFFAVRTYRNYDPEPWEHAENKPVGGWLILPAIGVTITPFILLVKLLLNPDYYNHNNWLALYTSEWENSILLLALFGAEIVYNILFLVFTGLVLILFYNRRTSLPRLISIYYILGFLSPLVDVLLANEILPEALSLDDRETYRDIIRGFIVAAVWVPYFNISKRVKHTFCKRYTTSEEQL